MVNIIAIVTPYKKNGRINWLNLNFLINFYIFNKINKILLLGTTGESHNFKNFEYINIMLFVKNYKINFFLNINKNNIKEIFYLFFLSKINKNSKILINIPSFILPNNLNLFKYFKIINKFGFKNILYNIPKRTSVFLNYNFINKIFRKKFFIYMKNSINNLKNSLIYKNKNIILFSGEDKNLYFCFKNNYFGTISVFNNIIPKNFFFINNKLNFIINKLNFDINPILIKFFLYKSFLIIGISNSLLFGIEKFFFTQSQT
ncbi:dihydrodipicolinate synthase family protein [Candidatus Carsonella ruddii]|uniref:dihydrodipicolinate synthase family protein n=1 Tax=Carsonella ruddii TaxID=114186 RepID=UPI001B3C9D85|nr:dihydrodipicolinate synthase family protein [Candidatus Carsonella ruddii]